MVVVRNDADANEMGWVPPLGGAPAKGSFHPSLDPSSVSIVIATADRSKLVLDCIDSWRERVPSDVELIVVDAGCADPVNVAAVLDRWPNSRVLRSSIRNAGAQRNLGVREAHGDIIVFLDDDTYVQPGWWPGIVVPLSRGGADEEANRANSQDARGNCAKGEIACVAGAVWCNLKPTYTNRRGGYVNWYGEVVQVTHRSESAPRFVDWPMTTNMAVLKSAYESVGGISEVYGVYDEDVDLGLCLRRAGYGIVFEPRCAVYHYFQAMGRKPATKRQTFMRGRNRAILIIRHFGINRKLPGFLIIMPIVKLGAALYATFRAGIHSMGHWLAYMAGIGAGIVKGLRTPVARPGK